MKSQTENEKNSKDSNSPQETNKPNSVSLCIHEAKLNYMVERAFRIQMIFVTKTNKNKAEFDCTEFKNMYHKSYQTRNVINYQ